jgi:uncharacterized membrane protein YgdD (TMEM256/DUF423 family)
VSAVARFLLASGALVMALAVIGGALSSHGLKSAAHPEAGRLLQTAVLYALVHGLGLLMLGTLARPAASAWLLVAGALLLAGIVLFCGSLTYLALTGRSLGPVAPLGGLAFIAGWLVLAIFVVLQP